MKLGIKTILKYITATKSTPPLFISKGRRWVPLKIYEFVWNDDIIEHIAKHDVTPEEVEEVCFDKPLIVKSRQAFKGLNPTYYALGITESGRYLFIMFIYFRKGRAMVVTARDMDHDERKYYRRHVKSE